MNLSDNQLLDYSEEHLCYEIHSLYAAVELFLKQDKVKARTFEEEMGNAARNLFLEGVILHSRSLYEFLYAPPSKNPKKFDDALAVHYFEQSGTWEKLRPTKSEKFIELSARTGKEIAHLTYSRLGMSEVLKQWDLLTITNDLLTILTLLTQHASKSKLHGNVAIAVSGWKNRHGYEPGQTSLSLKPIGDPGFDIGATTVISGKPSSRSSI